jgi:hypothetical protein
MSIKWHTIIIVKNREKTVVSCHLPEQNEEHNKQSQSW